MTQHAASSGTASRPDPINAGALVIAGGGNAARVTALALAAAGFEVALEPKAAAQNSPPMPDWQSVLALSPAAMAMLNVLDVTPRLDVAETPILDMQVYGRPNDMDRDAGFLPAQLGFGAPLQDGASAPDATAEKTVTPLGHIVSLAALTRALQSAVAAQIAATRIRVLPAALTYFDADNKTGHLANGETHRLSLLIDSHRHAPAWRQRAATKPLRHDYGAAALVAALEFERPHGHIARQIFLPDGPLALLPLATPAHCAMVWSLPAAKARALAACEAEVFAHELNTATQGRFGPARLLTDLATQELTLCLAQKTHAPHYIALGEAAHVVHPLAGQGFNLSLRDAAALAEALYETRRLGLPLHDDAGLAAFARQRRADAALVAAATHGLALGFQSRLAPMARFGLGLVGRALDKNPRWRRRLVAQANTGLSEADAATTPRLMRGIGFQI